MPVLLTLGIVDRIEQLPIGVTLKSIDPVPAKDMLVAHCVGSTFESSSAETADAALKVGPAELMIMRQRNDSRRNTVVE
jgi:hypothetical protein